MRAPSTIMVYSSSYFDEKMDWREVEVMLGALPSGGQKASELGSRFRKRPCAGPLRLWGRGWEGLARRPPVLEFAQSIDLQRTRRWGSGHGRLQELSVVGSVGRISAAWNVSAVALVSLSLGLGFGLGSRQPYCEYYCPAA